MPNMKLIYIIQNLLTVIIYSETQSIDMTIVFTSLSTLVIFTFTDHYANKHNLDAVELRGDALPYIFILPIVVASLDGFYLHGAGVMFFGYATVLIVNLLPYLLIREFIKLIRCDLEKGVPGEGHVYLALLPITVVTSIIALIGYHIFDYDSESTHAFIFFGWVFGGLIPVVCKAHCHSSIVFRKTIYHASLILVNTIFTISAFAVSYSRGEEIFWLTLMFLVLLSMQLLVVNLSSFIANKLINQQDR